MDLHQHSFAPAPIEFAIKNLLPGAKVQFALRYRHHHLAPHDLPFQVRIGIVLTRAIVSVLRRGLVWREFLAGIISATYCMAAQFINFANGAIMCQPLEKCVNR